MITRNIFMACMLTAVSAISQSTQFIHKHLIRSDASIVSGYMFKPGLKNVYLNGNLEYYIDNMVSIRGDANWMAGSSGLYNSSFGISDNHSVMLGPVFHIHTNNHFDPYFIVQPGIGYTSSFQTLEPGTHYEKGDQRIKYAGTLTPLGSAGVGFNYYFQRFAHLFCEARYVYGRHLSDSQSPVSLEEMRITFGLGFNLFIIKDKS